MAKVQGQVGTVQASPVKVQTAQQLSPQATVTAEDGILIVRIALQQPTPSTTGKTALVARTHGNVASGVLVNGKPVFVGLNAFIRA